MNPPALLRAAAEQVGVRVATAAWIAALGFAFPLLMVVGLGWRATREATLWFVQGERHPGEIMTAVALFAGGWVGGSLTRRLYRARAGALAVGFFGFFSFALTLVGLEEIAWGQWIYEFKTPDFVAAWNHQGELTLHNIEAMQGKNELLRLAFGAGGLIGIAVGYTGVGRRIGVPLVLLPWFLSIATLAGLDVYVSAGHVFLHPRITAVIFQMGEGTELLIGIAGLLYVALRRRHLTVTEGGAPS